jgi:hypothetical protein
MLEVNSKVVCTQFTLNYLAFRCTYLFQKAPELAEQWKLGFQVENLEFTSNLNLLASGGAFLGLRQYRS